MRFIFDKTAEIYRATIYSYRDEYFKIGTRKCIVLPVKAEDVMLTDGDPAKAVKIVADINADLKEGDKLVVDGESYIIKTIRKFSFKSLSRMECFANRPNN
jgi:hypothetical protein